MGAVARPVGGGIQADGASGLGLRPTPEAATRREIMGLMDQNASPSVVFKIEMVVGEHTLEGSARVPDGIMRLADLLPILQGFDDAVVGVAADKVTEAGRTISCQAGCGACCRQLVPISRAEAVQLAELVEGMPAERQAVVRERFRAPLAALEEYGLPAVLRR